MTLLPHVDNSYDPLEEWASLYVLQVLQVWYTWAAIANMATRLTMDMMRIVDPIVDQFSVGGTTFISISISIKEDV